jgi:hypothetical protein
MSTREKRGIKDLQDRGGPLAFLAMKRLLEERLKQWFAELLRRLVNFD